MLKSRPRPVYPLAFSCRRIVGVPALSPDIKNGSVHFLGGDFSYPAYRLLWG